MNTVLWIMQVILCIKFISVAYTHGLRQDKTEMQQAINRLGALARPLLIFVALSLFIAGLVLLLPVVSAPLGWLVPWAAALLAILMLAAIGFHLAVREKPLIVADLILLVMAAFVAYGRWVIPPY